MTRAGASFGPRQFPKALGLQVWEFERAVKDGLIRPAGADGRWPAEAVDAARGRLEEIRELVGDLPDCGATKAAEAMSQRLGVAVEPDTLLELARRKKIRVVGYFKDHPLYDGRQVAAFDDLAVLEEARWAGKQRDRVSVAGYLRVRASDVEQLIGRGWLVPVRWVQTRYRSKRYGPDMPLFRTGDLDVLLVDPRIDWESVRLTPKGRPSLLAKLPSRRKRRV